MGDPPTQGTSTGRTGRFGGRRGGNRGGRGGRRSTRSSGQRPQAANISRRDSAITAAFPPAYGNDKLEALRVPSGTNQGARLITALNSLATLARSKGNSGGAIAADELMSGNRHVFTSVSTTSANPYRIEQDFMVAIGPADYFKEETDDEDDPDHGGPRRPRARATGTFKTPVKSEPTEAAGAEPEEPTATEAEEPAATETTAPASRPPRARKMRPLTADECSRLGPYRMMTADERAAAPPFKEMSPDMAKTHVLTSAVFAYQQECKREAAELEDYRDASRTIFTRLLALLPEAAVDTMNARAG